MYICTHHRRGKAPDIVVYESEQTIEAEKVCDLLEAAGSAYRRESRSEGDQRTLFAHMPAFPQVESILVPAEYAERAREVLRDLPGLVAAPPPASPKPIRWFERPLTPYQVALAFGSLLVGTLAVALCWANWPGSRLPDGTTVDRVVVIKHTRRMMILSEGEVIREYAVSLGASPVGHKRCEGDERTPEGLYVLDWKNANSIAHLSVHVSYPNAADRRAAESSGRDPGGMIMVHGIRNGLGWIGRMHRFWDWTDGCVALTDPEMDEFFRVVPTGTPIEIRP